MPLDAYDATEMEILTALYAQDLEIRDCMAEAGLDFPVSDRRKIPAEPYRVFGIWSEQEAARYGYEWPDPPSEDRDSQTSDAPDEPEAWYTTHDACISPQVKALSIPQPTVAERTAYDTGVDGADSPAVLAVKKEWGACLSKNGVTPPTDSWVPDGAQNVDKATEIKVALIDVRCKEETDLVQRLADIDAAAQSKVIEKKQAALVAQRQKITESVDKARAVIAAHGG